MPSLLQDYTNGQTKKSTSAHKQETTFGSESGQHRIPISDAHWQTVIMRLGFATTILIAAPFTPTAHDSCRPDGVLCISITAGSRAASLGYRDGAWPVPGSRTLWAQWFPPRAVQGGGVRAWHQIGMAIRRRFGLRFPPGSWPPLLLALSHASTVLLAAAATHTALA